MKRFGWLAVVSCLCLWSLLGAGVAHAITYQFFQGGATGSLIVEFMTSDFVNQTTNLNPFTLTVAPAGLSTTGRLFGLIPTPSFQPTYAFDAADGSSGMRAAIALPLGDPSNQFPTSAGVFHLGVGGVLDSSGNLIAALNTLVISNVRSGRVPGPPSCPCWDAATLDAAIGEETCTYRRSVDRDATNNIVVLDEVSAAGAPIAQLSDIYGQTGPPTRECTFGENPPEEILAGEYSDCLKALQQAVAEKDCTISLEKRRN